MNHDLLYALLCIMVFEFPLPFAPRDLRLAVLKSPCALCSIRYAFSYLAQLPQLSGYFDRNLLILHNPEKKVVTTNYVLQTSLEDSI